MPILPEYKWDQPRYIMIPLTLCCFFPVKIWQGCDWLSFTYTWLPERDRKKKNHLILISCIHGPQSHKISVTTTTLCTNISLQSVWGSSGIETWHLTALPGQRGEFTSFSPRHQGFMSKQALLFWHNNKLKVGWVHRFITWGASTQQKKCQIVSVPPGIRIIVIQLF